MKILFVTPYLGLKSGGPSKVLVELAEGLNNIGISVDIISTNANGSDNLDVPFDEWVSFKSYRIKYFPRWNLFNSKISIFLTKWLFNHVTNYHIIHTHTVFCYPVLVAHLACQIYQIPYVRTPHGMLEPWALSYKVWKKRFYYHLIEKPTLERASFIHALTTIEAYNLKSYGFNSPTVVIPNGIHQKEFDKLPNPNIFYQNFPATRNKILILFLGRIDPKKGLDLLAPAFAKVHRQFPQTHLIVAGPDNIKTGFLNKAKSYFEQVGCSDDVTFTGMLTGSTKYAALASANLYIAPSYSEGFSMSILEAMACGLPCVITTGCNFPEAVTAKAARVVNIDTNAIADGLIECLNNPQQSQAMGLRAREFISHNYTWKHVSEKLSQVYELIIQEKSLSQYSQ